MVVGKITLESGKYWKELTKAYLLDTLDRETATEKRRGCFLITAFYVDGDSKKRDLRKKFGKKVA